MRSDATDAAVGPSPAPRPMNVSSPAGSASHDQRVERAADVRQRMIVRQQRGAHVHGDSFADQLGLGDQLDAVAEFARQADVVQRDVLDALDRDMFVVRPRAERDGREDRELMRGVEAADVHGGIGLGVTKALRVGEHVLERAARRFHLRQQIVAGAVEDAGERARRGSRRGSPSAPSPSARRRRRRLRTAAAPPCFSASAASSAPCLAISALLAVTTCAPRPSAASTAALGRPVRAADQLDERHRCREQTPAPPDRRTSDRRRCRNRACGCGCAPRRRRARASHSAARARPRRASPARRPPCRCRRCRRGACVIAYSAAAGSTLALQEASSSCARPGGCAARFPRARCAR